MEIALNPELEKRMDAEVEAGRAASPDDFINKAVYHFIVARDLGQEFDFDQVDALIAEGLDELERGEAIDGETAFRLLRAHSANRRSQLL